MLLVLLKYMINLPLILSSTTLSMAVFLISAKSLARGEKNVHIFVQTSKEMALHA